MATDPCTVQMMTEMIAQNLIPEQELDFHFSIFGALR